MSAKALDRLWSDYREHHQTVGNRTCHMVGIPLIMIGLLGLLSINVITVGGRPIPLSVFLVILIGAVEIWLDARLGFLMLVIALAICYGVRFLAWEVSLAIFVIGWVFQFIGHGVYEKRSPAFYRNLAHLIVGPLWVLNHVVHLRSEPGGSPASVRG
jgi:uncharacterized membrane protein YGL010W